MLSPDLYLPESQPKLSMGSEQEVKYLAEQICGLVETTYGHTLVLFTSYSLMGAVITGSFIHN